MSTVADYSILTKAFLAASGVNFSSQAFAVVPLALQTPLTTREALHFDWSKLGSGDMWTHVSCRDESGQFIGNIVRVQPSEMDGSIRLVAKVAVPAASENDVEDLLANTFVLLRMDPSTSQDPSTNQDLPIAVATISAGYKIHKHVSRGNDPLDAVDNATYVSFTINNLNGYTSVDFDPDAYAPYDVTDALSRRVDVLEGEGGIKGLHIVFTSNTGDIILSDSKGNVIDQANLHLDLSTDTIIAEGEEGYKYVKTDRNQDIHSAKAFMPVNDPSKLTSAFGDDTGTAYETQHASLVRLEFDGDRKYNGIRVRWTEGGGTEGGGTSRKDIFCPILKGGNEDEGTDPTKKYLAWYRQQLEPSVENPTSLVLFRNASGEPIEVTNPESSKICSVVPQFDITKSVYDHDAFVHTVGNSSLADWDEFFTLAGFHDGDDIPLGTNLPSLMPMTSVKFDPEAFIHGESPQNKENVEAQRKLAKEEMVAYNSRRPALTGDRQRGTIIDHTGLDVRDGSITLGCGSVGKAGVYGIQMKNRSQGDNISGSLDFTISHSRGEVQFDENGHARQSGEKGLVPLTSSTLLSLEAGSYISGAPTCLILAKVSCSMGGSPNPPEGGPSNPPKGSPVLTPVRMTAGFSVEQAYDASRGLELTIHDLRENISSVFNPNHYKWIPAIVEVQAIYTHLAAQHETVPAQQMHTYMGNWSVGQPPTCSFLCNKIEEWMTAIDLTDTEPSPSVTEVGLYVVIRVY